MDKDNAVKIIGEELESVLNEKNTESPEPGDKKPRISAGVIVIVAIIVATIVIFFLGGYFFIDSALNKSVINVFDKYEEAKTELRKEIQQKTTEFSESYYHISNDAAITIGDLKKCSNLEVLKVRASDYSLTTGNELENTLWLKVTETCDYVVDMTAAEFIIDGGRNIVIVRTPAPEPRNFALDGAPKDLFSYSTFFSGDNAKGRELLANQTKEADELVKAKIIENQDYYNAAKESASRIITNAILALNPKVEGLNVVVEFIENIE